MAKPIGTDSTRVWSTTLGGDLRADRQPELGRQRLQHLVGAHPAAGDQQVRQAAAGGRLLGARFGELLLRELGGAQQDRAEIERLEAGAARARSGASLIGSSSGSPSAGSTSTELLSPCAVCTTRAHLLGLLERLEGAQADLVEHDPRRGLVGDQRAVEAGVDQLGEQLHRRVLVAEHGRLHEDSARPAWPASARARARASLFCCSISRMRSSG